MPTVHDATDLTTLYTCINYVHIATDTPPPSLVFASAKPDNSDIVFYPYEWAQTFFTVVAWRNRRRAAHGAISRAQAIAPSSFCSACLTELHTLTRLYEHLGRDSPLCLHLS